jgi:hypothetical protein
LLPMQTPMQGAGPLCRIGDDLIRGTRELIRRGTKVPRYAIRDYAIRDYAIRDAIRD